MIYAIYLCQIVIQSLFRENMINRDCNHKTFPLYNFALYNGRKPQKRNTFCHPSSCFDASGELESGDTPLCLTRCLL